MVFKLYSINRGLRAKKVHSFFTHLPFSLSPLEMQLCFIVNIVKIYSICTVKLYSINTRQKQNKIYTTTRRSFRSIVISFSRPFNRDNKQKSATILDYMNEHVFV